MVKLTAFSKCERAMSVFFVYEWRSFPSCKCVRAWIAGDGWNWNTDWRHCIHCLILGGLDVLKVSAKPKRPMYEASWVPAVIVAILVFKSVIPREVSFPRETFVKLSFLGPERNWERKRIQHGEIPLTQFWENFGDKYACYAWMVSGGFWNTNFLVWLGFGARKMAVAAVEYWSEDYYEDRTAHWQETKAPPTSPCEGKLKQGQKLWKIRFCTVVLHLLLPKLEFNFVKLCSSKVCFGLL